MTSKLNSRYFIFDIEADGLLDSATKIHCLSIGWVDSQGKFQTKSTVDYDEMRKFFSNDAIVKVGHNIINYDNRLIEKLLGVKVADETVIDTLALSWYLFPTKTRHGLEEWGDYFGIPKPQISDWSNLTSAEYIHRCEEDIKINFKLFIKELKELDLIYDNDRIECERLMDYLMFKMFCVREQEDNPVKFDIDKAKELLEKLVKEREAKTDTLKEVMPKIAIKTKKTIKNAIQISPDEYYTKNDLLYDHFYQLGHDVKDVVIETIRGYEEPNPNSADQKKKWLYSLGWVPTTFAFKKEKDGSQRKIPQLMSDKKDGSLCDSIIKLFEVEPKLEVLEGLSILTHRIGMLEGLIRDQEGGYIQGSMAGFTNTLRLKHKGLVNLPKIEKKYGKQIRGLLIAEDKDWICGSDCSGLEDNCKQHYMYPYDPQYINEMRVPGFDPHLDIALIAGMLTQEEVDFFKIIDKKLKDAPEEVTSEDKKRYQEIKARRSITKNVNFASTYGAGAPKLALTGNIPLKQAKHLHTTYWKRNAAVKKVAESCTVKEINGQKWLFNPISRLWYSLRAEKDRFSTLNQGTGVWCFDTWVKNVRKRGIVINYQCHDEIMFRLNGKTKTEVKQLLNDAIKETNSQIKLNVPLGISIDFGRDYADCH